MSHGSQTLEAPRSTCPLWCIATHNEETTFHLQRDTALPTMQQDTVCVSAFYDEAKRTPGVYVGDYEMTPEQARVLGRELLDLADCAEHAAQAGGQR